MTQFLPPNLLALFAPRDPIPYLPPLDKLPHEKKNTGYHGVGMYLSFFEDPKDTPPPTRVENREERLERKRREKAEQAAYKLEQDIALWDPITNPNSTSDPFKTLFIARINYDTSESKLRREFEVYGPVKKIHLVHDVKTGKPRGYAFIEYEHERDMHSAYKHADGKKIDGRRVLVDVERARTVKGWLPRRLGGGLGGTRRGGPDVNIKHSGREEMGRGAEDRERIDRDRGTGIGGSDRGDRSMDRGDRSMDRGAERVIERGGGGGGGGGGGERVERDRDRDRRRSRSRSRERRRKNRPNNDIEIIQERGGRDRRRDRRKRSRERSRDRDKERVRDKDGMEEKMDGEGLDGIDEKPIREKKRSRSRERDRKRSRRSSRSRSRDRERKSKRERGDRRDRGDRDRGDRDDRDERGDRDDRMDRDDRDRDDRDRDDRDDRNDHDSDRSSLRMPLDIVIKQEPEDSYSNGPQADGEMNENSTDNYSEYNTSGQYGDYTGDNENSNQYYPSYNTSSYPPPVKEEPYEDEEKDE